MSPKKLKPDSDIEESENCALEKTCHNLESSVIPHSNSSSSEIQHFGIRTQPHKKFVWNSHLLR